MADETTPPVTPPEPTQGGVLDAWRKIRGESTPRGRGLYSLLGIGIMLVVWSILTAGEPTNALSNRSPCRVLARP